MSFALMLLLAAAAQDKLPPANPLPPPTSEEGQVMAPVNALFDGLARRDPLSSSPRCGPTRPLSPLAKSPTARAVSAA